MSADNKEQSVADSMDEYSTIPDYENIPLDFVRIPYLTTPLWRHQLQAIYCMLQAEAKGPIVSDTGEVFWATSGLLPMPTGTGKTKMMLGVANFPVDERPISHIISGTSLNLMMLKKKQRSNISTTVVCSKREIIQNAWIKDLRISYPSLSYFEFETIGAFEKEVLRSPQYTQLSQYIDGVCSYLTHWVSQMKIGATSQGNFEMMMMQIRDQEITTVEEAEAYIAKKRGEKKNLQNQLITLKIVDILTRHKVVFITKDSFHFLFRVFKEYTIDRLVFDEPQDITLTRQDDFCDYLPDPRSKFLRSIGRNVPFYEESPARFIWYVSATPYEIPNNIKGHYINGWIDRNDFVINDYISSPENARLFPELVARYVIKFPLSYILEQRPELQSLVRKFKLKCKVRAETNIVRGLISSEIDTMLENDDYEAVMRKLSVSGTANNILDAAVERITFDINKLAVRISAYDPATPAHVITKSQDELKEMKANLVNLQRKVNLFRGNHMSGEDQDCPICFEKLHVVPQQGDAPENRCVAHMGCMNVFHIGCFRGAMAAKRECPTCREEITKKDDIRSTYDANGYTIQQQVYAEDAHNAQVTHDYIDVSNDFVYENKLEAIKAALKPKVINGYVVPRRKVLLFINFKSDSGTNIDEIVRLIQSCGFSVRLPFGGMKIEDLRQKYPPIGSATVWMKKANSAIQSEIAAFKTSTIPQVWIFRSGKESSGLNFPFVDTSIQYSDFGRQVIGRALRMDRVDPLDLITLYHTDDGNSH